MRLQAENVQGGPVWEGEASLTVTLAVSTSSQWAGHRRPAPVVGIGQEKRAGFAVAPAASFEVCKHLDPGSPGHAEGALGNERVPGASSLMLTTLPR